MTLERCLLTVAAAAALIAPVCAQTAERRATFTGGSGNNPGKCTVEVYVDGAADVEIRGDRGFLRTLSGQPAQWRRFVCSAPMPANPDEFRFAGVDGRGRQELIQVPRSGRGAAVVTIQDPAGGAEGYTFDLVWRGGTFIASPTDQPWGMNRRGSPDAAVRACQNAVRQTANRQYGLRDIDFGNQNAGGIPGRGDTIRGSFQARRGDHRDMYRFSCAVDQANGRVRGVDILQGWGGDPADRSARGHDATPACQEAVEQKIQRDGYRNVQYGWLNAGNRVSDKIVGTARAQRGNNGRSHDFDIGCTVNLDNGNIKSIQVKRR